MGWTFLHDAPADPKQYLDNLHTWEDAYGKRRPLRSAMYGTTYYAAVEHRRPDNTVVVFAVVALTQRYCGEWGYKHMDESMGPGESFCPLSILALLTPTDIEWANNWRDRCRRNHEAKRNTPKPAAGMTVQYGGRSYRLDGPAGPRLGWNVTRDDGARFRMNAGRLAEALRGSHA